MSFRDIPVYSVARNASENHFHALKNIDSHPKINTFLYRGYKCMITLANRNTWNGYVTVDSFHTCHNLNHKNTLRERNEFYLDVHGGLSYSYTTETETVFGFHTCHIGDYIPTHRPGDINCNFNYTTFRSYEYVVNEIVKLVDQLYFYHENVIDLSFLFRED